MRRFTYNVYGFPVETSVFLGLPQAASEKPALSYQPVCDVPWPQADWSWVVRSDGEDAYFRVSDGRVHARFEEDIDFYIGDNQVFVYSDRGAVPDHLARVYFLGPAMSMWLELRGILALHASSVAIDGGAVAFLSGCGGGKTTLAVEALRSGAPLIADDIAALEVDETVCVRPAFPRMRLWPEGIPAEWGAPEDFPLVHPEMEKRRVLIGTDGRGVFESERLPLRCVYVPERVDDMSRCHVEALGKSEALMHLVGDSFAAEFAQDLGIQPARLGKLARIVSSVPVRKLRYPSGLDRVNEAWQTVVSDYSRVVA